MRLLEKHTWEEKKQKKHLFNYLFPNTCVQSADDDSESVSVNSEVSILPSAKQIL